MKKKGLTEQLFEETVNTRRAAEFQAQVDLNDITVTCNNAIQEQNTSPYTGYTGQVEILGNLDTGVTCTLG